MGFTRRNILSAMLAGGAAATVAGGLAGCASDRSTVDRSTVGGSAAGKSNAGAVDGASSPAEVSIAHKFGETKVPGSVSRVLTLGWNDQDFVLALGLVPVGVRAWFDNYDELPWVTKVTSGEALPVVASDEVDFEKVAAAAPDLILDIYDTVDRAQYERLSQIAPTVVQSEEYPDEETPWDVQLATIGRALGKEDAATQLLDQVNTAIAEAVSEHPEFSGQELVEDYGPESGGHYLIGKGDPRRAIFDALGFATQSTEGDLSEEKLDLLDRDVLFVVGATKQQMLESSLFSQLAVVTEDRTLYTTFESPLAAALSYSGPHALLYALDKLVPQLANALNGKPVEDLANA